MDPASWALSYDSLIVAAALSAVVPPRHVLPLIALFGICDAAGSLPGPLLGIQVAGLWLAPALLIVWGAALLLNLQSVLFRSRFLCGGYLLPPLMG